MARFDLFEAAGAYLLDCQSDVLDGLTTRFVVPVIPEEEAPIAGARLNPIFLVRGRRCAMVTQFAATIPTRDLKERVASLDHERERIMNALDMLISGF